MQSNNQSGSLPAGMIQPPPELKAIVDKTAAFVIKNGPAFEERIRENERHNTKFSFLLPTDPYRPYYDYKLTQLGLELETATSAAPAPVITTSNVVSESDKNISMSPAQALVPEEPPPYQFSLDLPAISHQDLDIIKLTAQFVAKNGRQFMGSLAQREQRNFQFDFLNPSHSLYPYFSRLVEQYSIIISPPSPLIQQLVEEANRKLLLLDRFQKRVDYELYQINQQRHAKQLEDEEKLAFASIDWQDFVIVDCVEFTPDDTNIALPAPITLIELQNMTIAQKKSTILFPDEVQEVEQLQKDRLIERAAADAAAEMDVDEVSPALANGMPSRHPSTGQDVLSSSEGPKKIRTDYVPQLGKKLQNGVFELCPICNRSILSAEIAEHMRIELLDPKWKQQTEAYRAKHRESYLDKVGGDVSRNLEVFSGHRSDIFGGEKGATAGQLKESTLSDRKIVWDGSEESARAVAFKAAQSASREEYDAVMRQHAQKETNIGPKIPGQASGGVGASSMPQQPHAPPSSMTQTGQPAPYHSQPGTMPHQYPAPAYPSGYGAYHPPPPMHAMYPHPPAPYVGHAPPPPMHHPYPPTYGSAYTPALPSQQQPVYLQHTAVPQEGIPPEKRARTEPAAATSAPPPPGLLAEHEFLASHSGPMSICIQPASGEAFEVKDVDARSLVSEIKERISALLSLAVSKQRLMTLSGMPMKNSASLAYYNIGSGDVLALASRERGKK